MNLEMNKTCSGMTLIEVTLVIAVLLGLTSVLFLGVKAYKRGIDRAQCILNVSAVQKAVRSYQNLHQMEPGETLLKTTIIGSGKMMETEPKCPEPLNKYVWGKILPEPGETYIDCDDFDWDHTPGPVTGW